MWKCNMWWDPGISRVNRLHFLFTFRLWSHNHGRGLPRRQHICDNHWMWRHYTGEVLYAAQLRVIIFALHFMWNGDAEELIQKKGLIQWRSFPDGLTIIIISVSSCSVSAYRLQVDMHVTTVSLAEHIAIFHCAWQVIRLCLPTPTSRAWQFTKVIPLCGIKSLNWLKLETKSIAQRGLLPTLLQLFKTYCFNFFMF